MRLLVPIKATELSEGDVLATEFGNLEVTSVKRDYWNEDHQFDIIVRVADQPSVTLKPYDTVLVLVYR